MTTEIKLPADADKRRRYMELSAQHEAKREAKMAASMNLRREKSEATDPLWDEFRPRVHAVEAQFNAKIEAAEADLQAELDALEAEMDALGLGERRYDDSYEVALTCELTGLPIFDDDELIRDEDTGEVILRSVLPWPEKGGA